MAIVFVEGFDWGDADHLGGLTPQKYTSFSTVSGTGVSVQPGRVSALSAGGGQAMRFENSAFRTQTLTHYLASNTNTLCLGVAYRAQVGFNSPGTSLFRFEAGGTTLQHPGFFDDGTITTCALMLLQNPDGSLSVCTGPIGLAGGTPNFVGTVLGTTSPVISVGTWYYLEMQIDAGAGTWALYIDDTLVISGSGVIFGLPQPISQISLQGFGFETHDLDDLYVTDGAQLGPCRVTGFAPASDAIAQWSPSAGASQVAMVGEFANRAGLSTPDGLTTYVQANGAPLTDTFNVLAPACYGRILALALNVDAQLVTPGPSANLISRASGTIYTLGNSGLFTSGFLMYQVISPTSPVSSTYWTDQEIGTTQFGFTSAGFGIANVTQFFLEKLVSLRAVPFNCGRGSYSFTQ